MAVAKIDELVLKMPDLKEKVAKGAVWTLMEKVSCQAVGFVVGMILARLLTPTDYGTVALTGIFFAVAGVLVIGLFCGRWTLMALGEVDCGLMGTVVGLRRKW